MSQPNDDTLNEILSEFVEDEVDTGAACGTALHWFRKCLRFHDNPALLEALSLTQAVKCIYIIDPLTINSTSKVETNKWRFLLESLHDLDSTLRKHNSRLYVLKGQPTFVLPLLFKDWHINVLSLEDDPTPYGARRDEAIGTLANDHGVYVVHRSSHTLHPIPKLKKLCAGITLATLPQFSLIFQAAGPPNHPLDTISFAKISPLSDADCDTKYNIPTFEQLGLVQPENVSPVSVWKGGETEALKRLAYHLERRAWVAYFDKPKMTASSLMASPNVLGPYLNFGCLSPRLLYWNVDDLYKQLSNSDSTPPPSLHGQLILREFWYLMANLHENFDQVQGNKLCLPIPWNPLNSTIMKKVVLARTGFPWIDAIVIQLVSEGWIHSMAKHALISFITHGQLFYSWEEAAKLLDRYCLEGDICTNHGVALLLSGTSLAKPLPANVETPVLTGKATDPLADFIRHYIPALRSFPAQYIYEPWTAPLHVQQQAGCVVGQDYPVPMFDHYQRLHSNMLTLQQFLKSIKQRQASRKRHPLYSAAHSRPPKLKALK